MGLFNKYKNQDMRIIGGNERRTYIPSMNSIVDNNRDDFQKNFISPNDPAPQVQESAKVITLVIQSGFSQAYLKNILINEPKDFNDVKIILDYIRAGQIVAISLNDLTDEVAQRILDFVSGASYTIGATVQRYEKSIFYISPRGYTVKPYRNEK